MGNSLLQIATKRFRLPEPSLKGRVAALGWWQLRGRGGGWQRSGYSLWVEPGGSNVVYIYPVEPNLCGIHIVTDSILGEYMVDAKTSHFSAIARIRTGGQRQPAGQLPLSVLLPWTPGGSSEPGDIEQPFPGEAPHL